MCASKGGLIATFRSKYQLLKILRTRFPSPPKSFGFLGNAPYLWREKKEHGTLAEAIRNSFPKYGNTILIEIGTFATICSPDTEFLRWIVTNDPGRMIHPTFEMLVTDSIRHAILITEGEEWFKKRRLLRNSFKKLALESYIPQMHVAARELGEIWNENYKQNGGKNVDILKYYNRLTNDVIGRVGFSFDFKSQKSPHNANANAVNTFLEITHVQYNSPLYQLMGLYLFKHTTPLGIKFMEALARIRHMFADIITLRLHPNLNEPNTKKNDLLQHIIDNSNENEKTKNENDDEEEIDQTLDSLDQKQFQNIQQEIKFIPNQQLTTEELISDIMVFFIAGYESTSNLLAWTTYHIAKNPHVKEKILDELKRQGFYDLDDETPPTFAMINNLPYLNQVLKETLRLYPAIAFISRETAEEMKYKDFVIPKGTTLFAHNYSTHRDPKHWKEPTNEWDPDRFTAENSKGRDLYAWTPFSAGIRNCIGMQFAMMEARLVLAYLLPRFKFLDPTDAILIEKLLFTSKNMKMTVKPTTVDKE